MKTISTSCLWCISWSIPAASLNFYINQKLGKWLDVEGLSSMLTNQECSSFKPFYCQLKEMPCCPSSSSQVLVLDLSSLLFLVGKHSGLPSQSALVFVSNNTSRLNDLKPQEMKRQRQRDTETDRYRNRDEGTKRQRDRLVKKLVNSLTQTG